MHCASGSIGQSISQAVFNICLRKSNRKSVGEEKETGHFANPVADVVLEDARNRDGKLAKRGSQILKEHCGESGADH